MDIQSTMAAESEYKLQISVVNKTQSSYFQDNLPKVTKVCKSAVETSKSRSFQYILAHFVVIFSDFKLQRPYA